MNSGSSAPEAAAVRIQLMGSVQGIGIRPAIARLAMQHKLIGSVRNSLRGVEISASGPAVAIASFQAGVASLVSALPEPSQMVSLEMQPSEIQPIAGFTILASQPDGQVDLQLPLDRVVCNECLLECLTPGNRRQGYALNSCSQCGPRYSIITSLPYDRVHTSMAKFSMCRQCEAEYEDPSHRRFHSQTNCCPVCGPNVWFEAAAVKCYDASSAMEAAAQVILSGQILALKGLGGYQLVCDATDESVVARVRQGKGRPVKPLAIMVGSLDEARELVRMDPLEEEVLSHVAGPIVIVESRNTSRLAMGIHPGLSQVGMMLPTSALHALLLTTVGRPLVVSSGNREGEPLEYREAQALERLGGQVDGFLHHDRLIVQPIDDSVVRCVAGRPVTFRAARGLAPMHVDCDIRNEILALGGQQKSAFALSNGRTVLLGPHVGDLSTLLCRERYAEQQAALVALLHSIPQVVVHDVHSGYFTSSYAEQFVHVRREVVQHHHAHIVAGMAEHGWLDRQVLGFAFDGTGAGTDNTAWGGEVLLTTAQDFIRLAHLRALPLLGGEAAIREPWRIAVALLLAANFKSEEISDLLNSPLDSVRRVQQLVKLAPFSPRTTSMGRLFDGVAALTCGASECSYEGEAALRLESICVRLESESYEICLHETEPLELDWRPMVRALVEDLRRGLEAGKIAMRFHRAVAKCVAGLVDRYPTLPVVLSGGVFQNRVLVEILAAQLENRTALLGLPGRIPPNDGGLCLGQLLIGNARQTAT